jgi:hypothetical protein
MMNFKRIPVVLVVLGFLLSYKPAKRNEDYVPNAHTAVKIAEAIWLPIYGKGIYDDKPFVARLKNTDVWVVQGTLAKGTKGGIPYIEIQKSDCKILAVSHGK